MRTSMIGKTLAKFGPAPLLSLIASELRKDAKESESVCDGTGVRSEIWADEIDQAILRANRALSFKSDKN